jgi:DNA invertase Pin-like site-specific DNA recombinase
MTVIGYARVSTTDQDLSIQATMLRGRCHIIRAEKTQCHDYEGPAGKRPSQNGNPRLDTTVAA